MVLVLIIAIIDSIHYLINIMKFSSSINSIISGFAGSIVLTALHQLLKANIKHAPRMDKLGEQALQKVMSAAGGEIKSEENLHNITMAGDLTGNALYYSMIGALPVNSVAAGASLGLAAGLGAILLPEDLGLNKKYSNATTETQLLTIAIYLAGGVVAGLVHKKLADRNS
jgi:sulfite exporter TauE/SafE